MEKNNTRSCPIHGHFLIEQKIPNYTIWYCPQADANGKNPCAYVYSREIREAISCVENTVEEILPHTYNNDCLACADVPWEMSCDAYIKQHIQQHGDLSD